MALIVETGTGSATAESYASVAYFQSYHLDRGNAAAGLMTTAQIEESLRKATDYMMQVYRRRWCGYKAVYDQALDWPRSGVVVDEFVIVDYQIVPVEVKKACVELALKSFTGELFADEDQKVTSEKIGPIEIHYDSASVQRKRYRAIDSLLKVFLTGGSSGMRLVRT